jgi:hypothetical protein
MFPKVPYDVQHDFAFVTQYCAGQFLFTVNARDVPVRTVKAFVAWVAQHKGHVSYGSYGTGWLGVLAPAGTPPPVLARLQVYGMEPAGDGAEAFRRQFQAPLPTYERLIKVSGAKAG